MLVPAPSFPYRPARDEHKLLEELPKWRLRRLVTFNRSVDLKNFASYWNDRQ